MLMKHLQTNFLIYMGKGAMKMWFECSLCSVIGMSIFTLSLVNSNTTLGVSTIGMY